MINKMVIKAIHVANGISILNHLYLMDVSHFKEPNMAQAIIVEIVIYIINTCLTEEVVGGKKEITMVIHQIN